MRLRETEKILLLDPTLVSDRFDEMVSTIDWEHIRTVDVAEAIGYFRAHIERDAVYYTVIEGGIDDEE